MMKRVFLLILSIILYFKLFASGSYKPILDSAFQNYKKGNYQKALEYYQKIEQQGLSSAYLYYNIGNSYFRLNQISKAILYYERALLLNPSNEDILHNLKFANTFVVDKINELPEPFYITWYNSYSNFFSSNTWAWIAIITFTLSLTFFYFNFLTSKIILTKFFKTFSVILFIVFVLSIFPSYSSYHKQIAHNIAIITTDAVEVKSSPDDNGTVLFVIHEGIKVKIKDEFEEWVEIRLADGNTGWVKSTDLEKI